MKKNIIGIIILMVGLLAPQITRAQGIVYVSNLGQASTGSDSVGSDSWLAMGFDTGTNASGYVLDSVQLGITDATGNPSGFTVMLCAQNYNNPAGPFPGSSLETLNGSANPSTGGIYTYTDASDLILLPSTDYFIVLTAGTTVANGAYEWSVTGIGNNSSYNPSGGWLGGLGPVLHSSNGSSWSDSPGTTFAQFAIDATAIPEPSSSLLILLGGGVFIYVRRTLHH
jgi:hypothetical protein